MKNVRSPVASRREMSRLFYESLTCRLRLEFFGAFVNCHRVHYLALTIKPTGMNPSRRQRPGGADRMWYQRRARMSLHRNDIAKFGVVRMNRRRYSPLSFDPHQMAAWTAQWRRRRRTSRREPRQLTDRRHRATVCALSACDINKSSGLAEKNSVRCGVMRADSTKQLSIPMFRVPTLHSGVSFGPCLDMENH